MITNWSIVLLYVDQKIVVCDRNQYISQFC